MNFGIPIKSRDMIIEVLSRWKEIEKAIVFGSRAIGNYKRGSDVDLAICGYAVTEEIIRKLSIQLNEEVPLPYYFDIIHLDSLNHEELKSHIKTYGKIFYDRNKSE